jgi:hypothetical protein
MRHTMARPIVRQAHGLLRRELLLQESRYVLHRGSGLVAGASFGTGTPGLACGDLMDGTPDPREVRPRAPVAHHAAALCFSSRREAPGGASKPARANTGFSWARSIAASIAAHASILSVIPSLPFAYYLTPKKRPLGNGAASCSR